MKKKSDANTKGSGISTISIREDVSKMPDELKVYGTRNEMRLSEATHKPGMNELPGPEERRAPEISKPPEPNCKTTKGTDLG
jgi:hypothetical protein